MIKLIEAADPHHPTAQKMAQSVIKEINEFNDALDKVHEQIRTKSVAKQNTPRAKKKNTKKTL